jgi:dTDP-4-dehydrorhamnose reductase
MRILLTGANGQLGRELTRILAHEELHANDHAALDIADREAVFHKVEAVRPAWVINAAAFNDVDGAESSAERAFAVNGAGPGHLAEAAARVSASIIHISTDYVFDGKKGEPYIEDDQPNPLSVYGRSKREGEERVLSSAASACVLRTAWLYGAQGKNFVLSILRADRAGSPLRVVSDQVGSPTWTADLAEAIGGLIQTQKRGLFHVVNAGACSRFEFARAITRGRVEVIPITSAEAARAAPRPAYSALTSVRWQSTGLSPLRSWETALSAFLNSTRNI